MKEILFESKYIEVSKVDGWYELSSSTGTNELVAVLVRNRSGQYLVRYENCPPYYDGKKKHSLVALTGMVEKGEKPKASAYRELLEEAGIERKHLQKNGLQYKGYVFTNKQSDLKIHCFVAMMGWNIPQEYIGNTVGDGTKGESDAFAKWRALSTCLNSKCGILHLLLAKALKKY